MHRSLSIDIDIDGFIFLSSSDRKAWQIMRCTTAVKIYWEDFVGIASYCKESRLRVLTSFYPVMQISRTEKWDTGTGAAGISCCPRWPDPHSWAIIYFIFADKLPERVISDVNMEIDTTSNGPPLSFPVPSPHGEQTWACKIHQSSTAAPTKCYESRIVMHKCLPRVAPFNSETKPCEWTKLGGWHQNII